MPNLVLIPCHKRDDFLHITLDHIIQANQSSKQLYVFLIDRGFSDGVQKVIDKFPLPKIHRYTQNHRFRGNTLNLMEGYKYAAELAQSHASNLVYLIEEDIWIGKDFFDAHERIQSKFSSFCVSTVRNQNLKETIPQDPALVYYHNTFQSLGISWKIENLAKLTPHATMQYYAAMPTYMHHTFPNSSINSHQWPEQDGLIGRIIERDNIQCMFTAVPRAYHAGFIGYNRPGQPLEGTLEARVATLKAMTADDMNARAKVHKDITPCPMQDYGVTEFVVKSEDE